MKDLNNQLYWIAEELKSYTDLTGERFDIEHAQRFLWQMIPILKEGSFPSVKNIHSELEQQLEIAIHFDKAAFSKKVDELYSLAEKRRNS